MLASSGDGGQGSEGRLDQLKGADFYSNAPGPFCSAGWTELIDAVNLKGISQLLRNVFTRPCLLAHLKEKVALHCNLRRTSSLFHDLNPTETRKMWRELYDDIHTFELESTVMGTVFISKYVRDVLKILCDPNRWIWLRVWFRLRDRVGSQAQTRTLNGM